MDRVGFMRDSEMKQFVPTLPKSALPALATTAGDRVQIRFWELFGANLRNRHTRRAYVRGARDFWAGAGATAWRRSPT